LGTAAPPAVPGRAPARRREAVRVGRCCEKAEAKPDWVAEKVRKRKNHRADMKDGQEVKG